MRLAVVAGAGAAALAIGGLLLTRGAARAGNGTEILGFPATLKEDVTAILVHPANPAILWAGAPRGLFASQDGGRSWRRVLNVRGAQIHDLAVAPSQPAVLYLATSRGVYRSEDGGRRWRRSQGLRDEETQVLAVAVHPREPDTVVIGTRRRVGISRDGGRTWDPVHVGLEEAAVRAVCYHPTEPRFLYIVAGHGVFRSEDGGEHWGRVVVSTKPEETEVSEETAGLDAVESELVAALADVGCLALDPTNPQRVVAGTSRGVVYSEDGGTRWRWLSSLGLRVPIVRHLVIPPEDPGHLYAATDVGVFVYSYTWQIWRPVEGIPTHDVRRLAWAPDRRLLWMATRRGLISVPAPSTGQGPWPQAPQAPLSVSAPPGLGEEPTIAQLQAAAIRYAEVAPQKIQSWRRRAALRAWLPSFTLGIDRDTDTTIGSSTSGGKTTFTVGPQDQSFGVDFGFTWDLGDLIWNPDQTSIDTRSRLMVQLRNDVVDEVTRLYFERRRLQVEYASNPIQDPALEAERQLRLQELAAQIDGLTGGYLSQNSRKQ